MKEPRYKLCNKGRIMKYDQTINIRAINLVMPESVEHLKLSLFYDETLVGLIFNKKLGQYISVGAYLIRLRIYRFKLKL